MSRTFQRAACGAVLLTTVGAWATFGFLPTDQPAPQAELAAKPVRVHPRQNVWVDYAAGKVILEGAVCIPEETSIEVFACPPETKEYESMLAVHATPQVVEAAILLATPANAGDATGVAFDVHLVWDEGPVTRRVRAQEWVIDAQTKKPVEAEWRYVRGGRRTEGELLTTWNEEGVLNLVPRPAANTLPPAKRPDRGAKVKIELTPRR